MTNNSRNVIDWRRRTKQRIVQAFNSKCGICGYSKCIEALDLHHLDPNEKEFSLASVRAWPKSWDKIVNELRKCVLLCCRCHREFHNNLLIIPDDIDRFNEIFTDYKLLERLDKQSLSKKSCPVCGKEMYNTSKTCSLNCGAKLAFKYKWELFDLKDMFLIKKMSFEAIAREVGCTGVAVKKRLKKEKII